MAKDQNNNETSSTYTFTPATNNPTLNTQRASQLLSAEENTGVYSKTNFQDEPVRGLAVASTNISIICNDRVIGMIQSFNISEQRTVTKLQSIGVEGVIQAVPGNTNGGSIQAQRVALYGERIYDALGVNQWSQSSNSKLFSTLKDQRVPFEIVVETKLPEGLGGAYRETYKDCWISSYKKSYTVQNITVSEDVTIMYADVE